MLMKSSVGAINKKKSNTKQIEQISGNELQNT